MKKLIKEINLSNLFTITSLLLGIITFIVTLGILFGANKAYYNIRVGAAMYFLMLTMTACLLLTNYGRKNAAYAIIGAFALSLIFIITSAFNNLFLDAAIPILITTGAGSVLEIKRNLKTGSWLEKAKNVSPHIIHLAVVIIVAGILLTTIFGTTTTMVFPREGSENSFQGYTLKFEGVSREELGYATNSFYEFSVYEDGNLQGTATIKVVDNVKTEKFSRRPGIYSSLTEDLYLRYGMMTQQGFTITAQITPYPILLWSGVTLFAIGIIMRMLPSLAQKGRSQSGRVDRSYDRKIEKELQKFREEKES